MDKVVEIEDDSENDFNNMAIMKAKVETDFLMGNYKNALKTIATVPKSKCSRINTAKFMRLHFVKMRLYFDRTMNINYSINLKNSG